MKGIYRKLLVAFVAVIIAAVAVIVFVASRPMPAQQLPNPNGYDELVKAGVAIAGDLSKVSTADLEGMRKFMQTNAEPLRLARVGLSHECAVSMANVITNLGGMMTELPSLKKLAMLLALEGRLAEAEGRPEDAAKSYLAAIQLGNEISKGGMLINRLVGIACEALGYQPLRGLVATLDCKQLQSVIAGLEKIDVGSVAWVDVMSAERMYARHELARTHNPVAWISGWWMGRAAIEKAETKHNAMLARLRLLTAEMALRCFREEHGQAPERLEQLVPGKLQRVPIDPFSGQFLAYRAQGTNWVLYSVGPDRKDDGGRPVSRTVVGKVSDGDLFVDSPW